MHYIDQWQIDTLTFFSDFGSAPLLEVSEAGRISVCVFDMGGGGGGGCEGCRAPFRILVCGWSITLLVLRKVGLKL